MVASSAVPCCGPSSSSFVLLDVFPMITSGLRDFTQEPYSGSPGQVRSNSALIAKPFARAHSSALQSWSVTPVNSNVIQCPSANAPPPHPMTTTFGNTGTESNEWAWDLCPIGLVSTGGKSGMKVAAASTVKGSAMLLIPFIPSSSRGPAHCSNELVQEIRSTVPGC